MRRKAGAVAALLALTGATLVMMAAPASAQTTYPPPACGVINSTQGLGSVQVGTTVRFILAPTCPFAPGTPVTVTVNGVPIPGKVADANGFVSVTITVISATLFSVDDPVLVGATCGSNTITATGFSTVANRVVTVTGFFTLICPGVGAPTNNNNNNNTNVNPNTNTNVNPNTNTNTNTNTVGGNRIDIGGNVINVNTGQPAQVIFRPRDLVDNVFHRPVAPRQVPGVQPIPKAQPTTKVAFTGANVVRWSLLALGALLVGGFLVGTTRRRSRKDDATVDDRERELTRT